MSQESTVMKIATALLVVAAFAVTAESAEAKGCLKGAVVGGVAGHYAGHHGVLGAAAGCLYGRHRAKEQERQQQAPEQHQTMLPPRDNAQGGGM
jgi:outer membrane lipoprotein SlyB